MIISKNCSVCGEPFAVRAKLDRMTCDKLQCILEFKRQNPSKKIVHYCEICNFSTVIDKHHEGKGRVEHWLCPNHHAMITRGVSTLEKMLKEKYYQHSNL